MWRWLTLRVHTKCTQMPCNHRERATIQYVWHTLEGRMRKSSDEFNLMQMTWNREREICGHQHTQYTHMPLQSANARRIRNVRSVSTCNALVHPRTMCCFSAMICALALYKWEAIHSNCHSIKCHSNSNGLHRVGVRFERFVSIFFFIVRNDLEPIDVQFALWASVS